MDYWKVIKMEESNWNNVKNKVASCLDGDIDGEIPMDVIALVNMLMETGNNNVANRTALAASVKAMLKDFPSGQVVWRRGNQGLLSIEASMVVETACAEIREAAHLFFTTTQTYSQPLLRKHGKSKGAPVFLDADDYANTLVAKAKQTARELFKSKEWDGTTDGLDACASYTEVQEEE